tara:strand:+ start:83 stop:1117 length:1035 start_codon:yes stop_codon:yes gene_type:complete
MAKIKLRDLFELGDYSSPYFVAELNTSHFGKIEIAKKMVDEAKKAGCHCVKFQSWTEETLYSKTYYRDNPIAKRFVKKFSFSDETLKQLSNYCIERKIGFASTPYSIEEANFLVKECNVPFVKVASMEINNHEFLKKLGLLKAPIVLSTGMSNMDEIIEAVKIIEATGNRNISILHCVSIYPVDASYINLNNILGLRKQFPNYPIGYSDHSLGVEMATAAIALGACLIEKHFTLDNKAIGMDNQMATEPGEMETLVRNCNNIFQAMGDKERILSKEEKEQQLIMRRSIVANKDLQKGKVLSLKDFGYKRPGTGFSPANPELLIGKKLIRNVEADNLITREDIEQ